MNFGQRLALLREKKNWSQYDVADRLGIKRPRYNAWEMGISKPRADFMPKIAELFEVSVDDLLGVPMFDATPVEKEEELSDEARMVARNFQQLAPKDKEIFKNLLDTLNKREGGEQ